MIYAMDLRLPGGVSGARVQMHQEPVYFGIWPSRRAEVCEAFRRGRRGPVLGPGGLGLIGRILRNPFDLTASRDEASALATADAYDQAEQLHSPPRPCPPCAARRVA